MSVGDACEFSDEFVDMIKDGGVPGWSYISRAGFGEGVIDWHEGEAWILREQRGRIGRLAVGVELIRRETSDA